MILLLMCSVLLVFVFSANRCASVMFARRRFRKRVSVFVLMVCLFVSGRFEILIDVMLVVCVGVVLCMFGMCVGVMGYVKMFSFRLWVLIGIFEEMVDVFVMLIVVVVKWMCVMMRVMRKSWVCVWRDIEDGVLRSGVRRGANGINSYFGLTVDACY